MKSRKHSHPAPIGPTRPKSAPVKKPPTLDSITRHLARVRRICLALPGATERLSHGEPTFFAAKRVFAMMSINHHDDGRLAVVIPLADGVQEELLAAQPKKYFFPAYVGVSGWIGLHLPRVSDALLKRHLHDAWRLVATKTLAKQLP